MDAVLLARWQFAFTVGFHYIFPSFTIGMAWFIWWFLRRYHKTGDEFYKTAGRFWLTVTVIGFAIGVATGIVMEFQFGLNWSEYSKVVGDIFGAPLAAEGIFAFFLESTFLGALLFGWNKFSPRTLKISALMVAVGATLSALWIIVANSWMQTPAGFEKVMLPDGSFRAELTSFYDALFNPSTIPRYLHTVNACLTTGAFFIMGISAWYIIKNKHHRFAQESMKMALVLGILTALTQWPIGHYHAVQVAETQPAKLAAFEGLFETQKEAPAILFGIINEEEGKMDFEISIPSGLSLLVGLDSQKEVQGLNDFPRELWPPLNLTFYPFHLMVFMGGFFVLVPLLGLFFWYRKSLTDNKWLLWIILLSTPLPFIAQQLGWISAEVGRQPWIVYNLLKTKDAISVKVPVEQVLASFIIFIVVYSALFLLWIFLTKRVVSKGPDYLKTGY